MTQKDMDIAWAMFNQVVHNAHEEKAASQKWEAWKKVTWQSRHIAEKQKNLKARMRAL